MKEFITISWSRTDGLVRSSMTLLCRDMIMASMIQSELCEIARKIQDAQVQIPEIEEPNIIPGFVGHS